jgi:hypothetical protein
MADGAGTLSLEEQVAAWRARARKLRITRHTRAFTAEECAAAIEDADVDRIAFMKGAEALAKDGSKKLAWTRARRYAENAMFTFLLRSLYLQTVAREELAKRVIDLEAKLADIEAKGLAGAMSYAGVWRDGQSYAKGTCVTSSGSLWHANRDTSERPGQGDSGWQLMAKRGRERTHRGHDNE